MNLSTSSRLRLGRPTIARVKPAVRNFFNASPSRVRWQKADNDLAQLDLLRSPLRAFWRPSPPVHAARRQSASSRRSNVQRVSTTCWWRRPYKSADKGQGRFRLRDDALEFELAVVTGFFFVRDRRIVDGARARFSATLTKSWFSISSLFQLPPMPNGSGRRNSDRASRLALREKWDGVRQQG